MKALRRSVALRFATAAVLLGASLAAGAAWAEENIPNEGTLSCRALYVAKLRLARAAAARGDQQALVAGLEQAQDVLRFCTEDPRSPGTGQSSAPAHVIGRAGAPAVGACAAG